LAVGVQLLSPLSLLPFLLVPPFWVVGKARKQRASGVIFPHAHLGGCEGVRMFILPLLLLPLLLLLRLSLLLPLPFFPLHCPCMLLCLSAL